MSNIEFDEIQSQSYVEYDKTPKIVSLVIQYSGGLIKDEKQAQYFLLGFIFLVFVISFFILFSGENEPETAFEISPLESVGSEQGVYRK